MQLSKEHKTLAVRGVTFGAGIGTKKRRDIQGCAECKPVTIPICVSVMADTEETLYDEMKRVAMLNPDMIEWRIDFYRELGDICDSHDRFCEVLGNIRQHIGDIVLLVTYRTKQEGGMGERLGEDYAGICQTFCSWGTDGLADMLDVEYMQTEYLKEALENREETAPKLVMSFHDFDNTPEDAVLHSILTGMAQKGADICKLAVMPESESDVSRILDMTKRIDREYQGQILLMTISMGEPGMRSRVYGGAYGSCFTFASAGEGQASAPGQIPINVLREMMEET